MKKLTILFIILICHSFTYGQGIQFKESNDWQEILLKAAKENKYIFVDCFATWCSPCKAMDREVFVQPEIGDFFQDHFISVKIQFDSTGKDSESVRKWFAMAKTFEKQYKIVGFPTYLFFNPSGNLVSKFSGAITPAAKFLAQSRAILNPDNQYYTLIERYRNGDKSNDLIKKMVPEALRLQDWETIKSTHEQFVDLIDSPYKKSELIAVYAGITNSNSKGFSFILKDLDHINKILEDDGRIQSVVTAHLYAESYERYVKGQESAVKWRKVLKYIEGKAPGFGERIVLSMKINTAHGNKEWEKFGSLKMDYFDAYASIFDHNQQFFMNNELMEVFRKCSDRRTLIRAANWSKYTLDHILGHDNAAATDTYANLLYKAGNKQEAIIWQEKALELISRNKKENPSSYEETLQKMKLGVPTWVIDTASQRNF